MCYTFTMMKIILLDQNTVNYGDIDFSEIYALGEVTSFNRMPQEELPSACAGAEALLINKAEITRELLSALPSLRYVGAFATGYNNVDLAACKEFGVTFANAPSYSTNAVAQHTLSLLLMCVGSTHRYAESVARGDWLKSDAFSYYAFPQEEVFNKTFGVLGYGEIGKAVAKICDAFGMKVLIFSRTPPKDCPYEVVTKEELFSRSDYLSLHCPLTEETKEIVNERTLSLMKPSAVLLNTARGGLIDEAALSNALRSGKLRFACLDVVSKEPMEKGNPLFGLENVLITPHVAWAPKETRQRLVSLVAANLKAFLLGKPQNVIV